MIAVVPTAYAGSKAFTGSPCWSDNCRGLVASQLGLTTITGSFASFSSSMAIKVLDPPVTIVSMVIVDDIGTDTTLNGVVVLPTLRLWACLLATARPIVLHTLASPPVVGCLRRAF